MSQTLVVRPPHVKVAARTVGVGGVALTVGPVAVKDPFQLQINIQVFD